MYYFGVKLLDQHNEYLVSTLATGGVVQGCFCFYLNQSGTKFVISYGIEATMS